MKTRIGLMLAVLGMLFQSLNADITTGLAAYYPFNGNANDASGNSNNGAVKGATLVADRHGKADSAYHFNGVSDHITLNPSATLSLGANGFSLSAWVNAEKVYDTDPENDQLQVIVADGYPNLREFSYFMGYNQKNLQFSFAGSSSYPNNTLMQSAKFYNTFEANKYYHIATVYDGDKVYGYVNGELVSSKDVDNSIKPYTLIDNVVIGMSSAVGEHGYPRSTTDYWVEFQGIIDDVRIYNRGLTASDVKELYDSEKPFNNDEYIYVDVSAGPSGTWTVSKLLGVPSDLLTNDVWRTNRILLRKISAGTFVMGSPTTEIGHLSSENQHDVTLTKPFYIGVFEVTQKQYENVMGTNPSHFSGNPKRPVEKLSWNVVRGGTWPSGSPATATFLGKIRSKLAGHNFDLPTEAQWEYACRAGTVRAFNDQTKNGGEGADCTTTSDTGEDLSLNPLGWYSFNSGGSTHDVGGKQANAWGLYDMHGNAWEWCLDWYEEYSGDAIDPVGASSGTDRRLRGGDWDINSYAGAKACRSALRGNCGPDFSDSSFGFRIALPAETSLVAYYPFNGNAVDESGNGNNGTVNGATLTTDRFGNPNSAYYFDGQTNYIKVIPSTSLDQANMTAITYSLWFCPDDTCGSVDSQRLLYNQDPATGQNDIDYRFSTGKIVVCYYNQSGFHDLIGNTALDKKLWNHVVVKYDYAASSTKIYVNGVFDGETNAVVAKPVNPHLIFGAALGNLWFYKGKIDDTRVYNRGLSDTEVKALYDSEKLPPSDLVAYYPFNGNANDESGNGNNATIANASLTTDRFGKSNSAMLITTDYGGANTVNNIPISGNADRTIAFWCKFSTDTKEQPFVKWGNSSSTGTKCLFSEHVQSGIWFNGNNADIDYPDANVFAYPPYSQWRQIVFVYKTSLADAICYLNGTVVQRTGGLNDTSTLNTISTPLMISGSTGDFLDDVRIYNRALSASDVQALYDSEKPPASDLVAYYPFNGNAIDESGNGNNGTVNGATLTADRFGKANSAYSFNGTSDFINVPDSSTLDLTNKMTLCAWTKVSEIRSQYSDYLLGKGRSSIGTGYGLSNYDYNGNNGDPQGPSITLHNGVDMGYAVSDASEAILNKWQFIAGTYDGEVFNIYIDGILCDSYNNNIAMTLINSTEPLNIGRMASGLDRYHKGLIDDVRIYNRALSGSEIADLYVNEKAYTVNFAAGTGGSLNGTTIQTVAKEGDCTAVTAIPNENYHFVNWITASGGTYAANPLTITKVTSDMTVTANFEHDKAGLTMAVTGNGTTNPALGIHQVDTVTAINITATPDAGNRFVNWTLVGAGLIANTSSASTTVSITGATTVTANFVSSTTNALLMMAVSPDLSGSTTPLAGTISTFPTETELPITATPGTGYTFVNWTAYPPANAIFANANSAVTSVTLTATATITANFTKDNAITVTSPNGGEKWQIGTTQTITWTSAGIEGAIRIDLYKSGKLDSAITTETLNDGSYSWPIPGIEELVDGGTASTPSGRGVTRPSSMPLSPKVAHRGVSHRRSADYGGQVGKNAILENGHDEACPSKGITVGSFYKIRVSSASDPTNIYGESANYFSITNSSASIAVTAPISGSTHELGSATNITWTSVGITGNLKIDLYKGGVFVSNLSASETDDGTYAWTPEISEQLSVNSYQQENKNNMGVQESRAVIPGRQENGGLNSIQPRSSRTRPSKGIVPGTNYTIKITSLDDTNVSGSSGQFALTSSGSTATLTMALSPVEGGIITPPAGAGTVSTNVAVTITADANDNYTFLRWSASPVANASISNPNAPVTTVTLTGNTTVTALFSSTGGGYAAFDANSKVKITVDSAKQSKDSVSIVKGKLPQGFVKPAEGDTITILVDEWSLSVNAGYKASGDGNKITYKGETVANGAKTNKYQLALDFKKLEWNLRVASADLSTGTPVDSFDGLDVMLNVNGTLLGQNIATDDTVKWRFSSEKNSSEQLELTGEEWLNFAVDKADGSKINYKPSKDAFNVGSGAGDIIVFDSAADSVIVSIDGYEVALDDADEGSAWKSGNGRHTFKGKFDGVTTVQFVLDLSKESASWKFKISKADFWDDVDGSDGLDFRVIIGGYEGGLQLGADQITTMSYPQK